MEIPLEQLPGMSRLAVDYYNRAARARAFFADDYRRLEAWPFRAESVLNSGHADRKKVVDVLRRQNLDLDAGPATMANLDALAGVDALVIVTGQQSGLFGGPLYTLYKALTACKLAVFWSKQLLRPVVPVFYVVSEDHDFIEVQSTGYLDGFHHFKKAVYNPAAMGYRQPVGEVLIDAGIHVVLAELTGSVAESEFKAEIVSQLASCYQSGVYFAQAFCRWYAHLLSEQGMIFLDPSDPELKTLAAPVFARELEQHVTARRMQQTNERLESAGYALQLPVHPARPALFLLHQGRHGLERAEGGWRNLHSGQIHTLEELLATPERLSPKAALRPLFEDYLLPTLAYVGGPGEISYWAQLGGVYEEFQLPMPLVVPRAGFTLLEGKSRRTLERFGIDAVQLLHEPEGALTAIRERLVPSDLAAELGRLREMLTIRWPQLAERIAALDVTLEIPAGKSLQQLLHTLTHLEQKVMRAAEQKQATMHLQLEALVESLRPGGVLQERQLNSIPFFCRHGLQLVNFLYEAIDAVNPVHRIMEL